MNVMYKLADALNKCPPALEDQEWFENLMIAIEDVARLMEDDGEYLKDDPDFGPEGISIVDLCRNARGA